MKTNIPLVLILIGTQCINLAVASRNNYAKNYEAKIRRGLIGKDARLRQYVETYCQYSKFDGKNEVKTSSATSSTVVILYEGIQHCTGALISFRVVLTAAHCVFGKNKSQLKVRAGAAATRIYVETIQERRIQQVSIHNYYNDLTYPTMDIALLLVENSFALTYYVTSACLAPSSCEYTLDYAQCFTSGWQLGKAYIPASLGKFKEQQMTVIPSAKCEKVIQSEALGSEFHLDSGFMCAYGVKRTILTDNGGAPLICKIRDTKQMMLFGVLSWGFNTTILPDVYTSIAMSNKWIENQLMDWHVEYAYCKILP